MDRTWTDSLSHFLGAGLSGMALSVRDTLYYSAPVCALLCCPFLTLGRHSVRSLRPYVRRPFASDSNVDEVAA